VNLRVRVLVFLRERVRDLRVQECLRGLVGVAVPSDLAGSVIIEILHCSEGGNIEQVARNLKQISSSISYILTIVYILHNYTYLYMLDIVYALKLRKQLCISTLILREIVRRSLEPFP